MLGEDRLICLESGIYEFNALSLGGDEEFEDLSPRAKCVVLDMLATIRELQTRVALLLEQAGFADLMIRKLRVHEEELGRQLSDSQARVVELETKCERCGLRLSHSGTPDQAYGVTTTSAPIGNADFDVVYIDGKPTGKVVLE